MWSFFWKIVLPNPQNKNLKSCSQHTPNSACNNKNKYIKPIRFNEVRTSDFLEKISKACQWVICNRRVVKTKIIIFICSVPNVIYFYRLYINSIFQKIQRKPFLIKLKGASKLIVVCGLVITGFLTTWCDLQKILKSLIYSMIF